jgi:hypothetical protein
MFCLRVFRSLARLLDVTEDEKQIHSMNSQMGDKIGQRRINPALARW